jgi:Domain of unknown function (DUF222)
VSRCSDTEDWAVDTEEALAAEVAATLRIRQALAGSRLRYARAMRERLPKVGAVFAAGDIDQRRAHPCLKSQVLLPYSPFGENVFGLRGGPRRPSVNVVMTENSTAFLEGRWSRLVC